MALTSYPIAGISYKDIQNFLIGQNLSRKASQLAGDLDLIRRREENPEAFAAKAKQSTTLSSFNQRIEKSIEEIVNIRKSLGVQTPESRSSNPLSLEELLKPEKGSQFNSLF